MESPHCIRLFTRLSLILPIKFCVTLLFDIFGATLSSKCMDKGMKYRRRQRQYKQKITLINDN